MPGIGFEGDAGELGRAPGQPSAGTSPALTKPSIGQIFIVDDAVHCPATDTGKAHGYVTRVTVR